MGKIEDLYTNQTESAKQAFKKNIYDWLSAAIIVAIIVIGLNIFKLRDVTWETITDMIVEWVPFFLAATLLDRNLYNKGLFVGKSTKNYRDVMLQYSKHLSAMTGYKLKCLPIFCKYKNEQALKDLQEQKLKEEGISIDDFDDIKQLSEDELKERFTDEQVAVIKQAKSIKIAGLKVNLLLGSNDVNDDTFLGPTEVEITSKHNRFTTIGYIFSTLIMTFIGVKDIILWGWAGLLVILFKTAYTFVRAYLSYFKGYGDITVGVCNHVMRKVDILKEYDYYFENNFQESKT